MITPDQRKKLDEIISDAGEERRCWEIGYELPDGSSHQEVFYGTENEAVDALDDLLEKHDISLRIFPTDEPN